MGLFSGCLLASDVDGTLLENEFLNPRNIEKIEYFVSEGGYFSLSTGRSVGAVGPVLSKIKHISPSVLTNGSMIYDFENKKILYDVSLPKSEHYIAKKVIDMGLDVGIEIHCGDIPLTVCDTKETKEHREYEWFESEITTFEKATHFNWNKVLYLFDNPKDLVAVREMISKENTKSVFQNTSAMINGRKRTYYEQIPEGVSKASALDKLTKMLKIDKGCFFAIGDYYNDVEMLKKADISAVPSDSPEEIKELADFLAGKCRDGAVADFINYLTEQRKGMV